MKRTIQSILILLIAVSLGACSLASNPPPAAPTQNVEPTLVIVRTEAAATVAAQLASQPTATQLPPTATLAPSATAVPTNTEIPATQVPPTNTPLPPQPTSTPIPTLRPTSAISSTPIGYACSITASSGGGKQLPGADFDARWTVKNIGANKWLTSQVDYKYSSGTKLQKFNDIYDLPSDVASGESLEIIVDMKAPTAVGIYTDVWTIVQSGQVLCNLPIQITVK